MNFLLQCKDRYGHFGLTSHCVKDRSVGSARIELGSMPVMGTARTGDCASGLPDRVAWRDAAHGSGKTGDAALGRIDRL
jgi:hypothetical protein